MKMTAASITDEQIRELQVEAEREGNVEIVRECLRAYRGNGGGANPWARTYLVALINERAHWVTPDRHEDDHDH